MIMKTNLTGLQILPECFIDNQLFPRSDNVLQTIGKHLHIIGIIDHEFQERRCQKYSFDLLFLHQFQQPGDVIDGFFTD